EKIVQRLSHSLDEFQAGKYLRMFQAGDHGKILGHLSVLNGGDNRFLQLIRERRQLFVAVQLAPLSQGSRPGEDRSHGIGGRLFALQMAVIMSLHSAMRGLILVISVGRNKYGSHHGKRTESRGYHIAHHISVIILAGPDETALGFHYAGNNVVDEAVEISKSGFVKLLLELLFIDPLENLF